MPQALRPHFAPVGIYNALDDGQPQPGAPALKLGLARRMGDHVAGLVELGEDQLQEALKKEALSLGAKGFIIKPFQKEALLAAISSGL